MCEKLRDYVIECFAFGVEVVSLYLSSVQNFTRTKEDIDAGCMAEHVLCSSLLPDVTKNFDAKVINAGNIDILPIYLQESAKRLAHDTSQNMRHKLYLCLAYNPIDEIRFAFKNYNDSEDLLRLLWVSDPVDLLIRTGKGELASSFLPLQCAGHAKIYSFDELFLDTSVADIRNILVAHKDSKTKKIQSVDDLIASQSD